MVTSNKAWSKTQLLPQFYNSLAKGVPAMTKAWDTNCKTSDVQQAHCLTYFPKCRSDRSDNSECLTLCAKMMNCADLVSAACISANPLNTTDYCNKFSSFAPRGVGCDRLCGEYQNDYKPPQTHHGSTVPSFMSVWVGLVIALIKFELGIGIV